MRASIGTRTLVWSAIVLALLFGFAALGFGVATSRHITACTFAEPECSSAIATWFIGFVTAAAFLAAYEAASKAGQALRISQRTFELEIAPVLGVTTCSNADHTKPRKAIYIINNKISLNLPGGMRLAEFAPIDFDFENLGRIALLDLVVGLKIDEQDSFPISLGNIGADKEAHISVFLPWDAPPWPTIAWLSPASVAGRELEFSQFAAIRVEQSAVIGQHNWTISLIEARVLAKPVDSSPKGTVE